ncbi:hypothetical protein B0H17DRAFT_1203128 [Mycena rosella]|uniref:Short-chain dehydrogenase n=1 Tax=Mycena rosella TaxID=1033263 RepID=A0AAD7DC05_MYCRO|nr:hypothetical protein B0H17DRAFT_1203128 [Mycena rosella]
MSPSTSEFGFHTTAEEAAEVLASEIAGKNVLVTGTSLGGIGFETARVIAKYANLVIIAGYNAERLQLAEDAIKNEVPAVNIRKLILDLSSLAAVRVAAAELNAYPEPLHVLINNAVGALAPFKVTVDNLEKQMATGHVGPFLFTNLIAPKLLAAASSSYTPRVIFVASAAHTFSTTIDFATLAKPDPSKYESIFHPYNDTKGANVLTAIELSRRAGGKLNAYALHPGLIYTNGARNEDILQGMKAYGFLDAEGKPVNSNPAYQWKSIPEGAATTVVAAFDSSLSATPGAYLDDCKDATASIAPYAADSANGALLWEATEKILGQTFKF